MSRWWSWMRRRPVDPAALKAVADQQRALSATRTRRGVVRDLEHKVADVNRRAHRLEQKNHFAELFREAMRREDE